MKPDFHPAIRSDIARIVEHVIEVTGDNAPARRRAVEIDDLIDAILDNPLSGNRLGADFGHTLARHGGRDRKITIVFRPDEAAGVVRFFCVTFGGADWFGLAKDRL